MSITARKVKQWERLLIICSRGGFNLIRENQKSAVEADSERY